MLLGIILIIFGVASLSFAVNSYFYLIAGIGLILVGIGRIREDLRPVPTKSGHSSDSSYSGSYDGCDYNEHTGSGIPEGAYLEGGRYESFSGQGWTRDAFGNPCNYITGVSVERDFYGDYRFSDDDGYGSIHDSAEYGRYNMYYGD
ncbi:MAG: DUF308 domain-containing protein [Ruminococcaceae bacterium]|nr:DUF308 domain-containing protein [Oscillospiraceae bacterium]